MSEMSEQSIESIGKCHIKNVSERRGSGQDANTLAIIARRTTVVNAIGIVNEILPYFRDLYGCKNTSRYAPLWSENHEEVLKDVSWRDDTTSFVFGCFILFCFEFKIKLNVL